MSSKEITFWKTTLSVLTQLRVTGFSGDRVLLLALQIVFLLGILLWLLDHQPSVARYPLLPFTGASSLTFLLSASIVSLYPINVKSSNCAPLSEIEPVNFGEFIVFGTQGHTAYPHLADNPIHRITKIITAIIDSNLDDGNEHFQPSTLQFSSVDVGNSTTNVIPSKAVANFNIRFNNNHSLESLEGWIKKIIQNSGAIGPDQFDLNLRLSGDAFITPPGELSNIISDSVKQVTNRIPDLSTTGGTSDARFIKDYCPVAEFGMVGKSMHKTNECVKISDLEELTKIYFLVLERFFKKI